MAATEKKYFEHPINDITIATVGDLLFNKGSFITGFGVKGNTRLQIANDFINYNGDLPQGSETNLDKIIAHHTTTEIKELKLNDRKDYDKFPIKFGTIVLIPFSAIDRDLIPLFGDVIESVDSVAFLADQLKNFYTDKNNVRVAESTIKSLGTYKEMFNHISVWLWSKSLSSSIAGDILVNSDKLINITPYIGNLTTNVNKDGGSFSFTLDPILGKFNKATSKWEIDSSAKKDLKTGEYVSHSRTHNANQKQASYFFHNIIQENDLVFIRFERLKSEPDRINDNTFEVNQKELQFKIYDMIGLVDAQSLNSNFANNDINIEVHGRDLMKLFIEDGVYFYPFDFIKGGIFANANKDKDDRLKRYDGQLMSRFQIGFKKIDNVLKFIINSLGTIKICSDNLFSAYQNQGKDVDTLTAQEKIDETETFSIVDRRTQKYKLTDEELEIIIVKNAKLNDDQKDEDLKAIRTSRDDSKLTIQADDEASIQKVLLEKGITLEDFEASFEIITEEVAIAKEEQIVNELYGDIQSFLRVADNNKKLRNTQRDWIGEFKFGRQIIRSKEFPDFLHGDEGLYLTKIKKASGSVNDGKEPTALAKICMEQMIKNFFLKKERSSYKPTKVEKIPLKGIWQIIKLVIDSAVHDRVLVDSSIGNEHGSLINAIRKICQEPFVEFYGDTYGDQYYLTVRKPPFDREGFLSLLNGNVLGEDGKPMASEPIVINIDDADILDSNLQYGAEVFSWYHLNPMGNLGGGASMAFTFLRAVFFKEYADLFGSKPLDLQTNYIPFIPFVNGKEQRSSGYMIKQGIKDLQYMIQSNAYLPFVRRGTITIANGNRKIKRGCLIQLTSTGEVGFVEAVTHNASFNLNSINRHTTISVDRLMVKKYIKTTAASDEDNTQVSYFDLIDTSVDDSIFKETLTVKRGAEIMSKWKVNADVFDFFINARQFV